MAEKPHCRNVYDWLFNNYAVSFAPFTDTDSAALEAFVHTAGLWFRSDLDRRDAIACALGAIVLTMQPSNRWTTKAAIPMVSDWGWEEDLWQRIVRATPREPDKETLLLVLRTRERLFGRKKRGGGS